MTATETELSRWEQLKIAIRYKHLAGCPDARAEAIARHYTSVALIARSLLEAVERRSLGGPSPLLDSLIRYESEKIQALHREDLGLGLEWKENQ